MAAAAVAAAAAAAAAASLQVLEMESMETAAAGSAGLAAEVRGSGTVDFGPGPGLSAMEASGGDRAEAEDFSAALTAQVSWRQNSGARASSATSPCASAVREAEFRAHRSVLAAATEYFTRPAVGSVLRVPLGSGGDAQVGSSPGPEPTRWKPLSDTMYTGRIRVSTGSVHEVLELADR